MRFYLCSAPYGKGTSARAHESAQGGDPREAIASRRTEVARTPQYLLTFDHFIRNRRWKFLAVFGFCLMPHHGCTLLRVGALRARAKNPQRHRVGSFTPSFSARNRFFSAVAHGCARSRNGFPHSLSFIAKIVAGCCRQSRCGAQCSCERRYASRATRRVRSVDCCRQLSAFCFLSNNCIRIMFVKSRRFL